MDPRVALTGKSIRLSVSQFVAAGVGGGQRDALLQRVSRTFECVKPVMVDLVELWKAAST